jgi:hypothetical protein
VNESIAGESYYIQVETYAGVVLGWIYGAQFRWTWRLDGAGNFSLTIPGSHPGAQWLAPRTIVRLIAGRTENTGYTVFVGVVENLTYHPDTGELEASGSDELGLLSYRIVGDMAIEEVTQEAAKVIYYKWPYWVEFTPPYSSSNPVAVYSGTNQWIYIGRPTAFEEVVFEFKKPHDGWVGGRYWFNYNDGLREAKLVVQYWDEIEEKWKELQLDEDTTVLKKDIEQGGEVKTKEYTMGQDGSIKFTPPAGWGPTKLKLGDSGETDNLYWIRYKADVEFGDTERWVYTKVDTITRGPLDGEQAIQLLLSSCPEWSYTIYGDPVPPAQLQFSGETVLSALLKLAETVDGHVRWVPTRKIGWLQGYYSQSLVAFTGPAYVTPGGFGLAAYITSLVERYDTQKQVTRVYPVGGGEGEMRVTLKYCTRTPPDFYTLNTEQNYIAHSSDQFLRVDAAQSFPEVTARAAAKSYMEQAANTLFDRALAWLRKRVEVGRFFEIEFVNVGFEHLPIPGDRTRLIYSDQNFQIDEWVYLLEVSYTLSEGNITGSARVSTVERWLHDDAREVVMRMDRTRSHIANEAASPRPAAMKLQSVDRMHAVQLSVDSLLITAPNDIQVELGGRVAGIEQRDPQGRVFFRASCRAAPYFRIGYPDQPGIEFDGEKTTIHGDAIIDGTITVDKLVTSPMGRTVIQDGVIAVGSGTWPNTYSGFIVNESMVAGFNAGTPSWAISMEKGHILSRSLVANPAECYVEIGSGAVKIAGRQLLPNPPTESGELSFTVKVYNESNAYQFTNSVQIIPDQWGLVIKGTCVGEEAVAPRVVLADLSGTEHVVLGSYGLDVLDYSAGTMATVGLTGNNMYVSGPIVNLVGTYDGSSISTTAITGYVVHLIRQTLRFDAAPMFGFAPRSNIGDSYGLPGAELRYDPENKCFEFKDHEGVWHRINDTIID